MLLQRTIRRVGDVRVRMGIDMQPSCQRASAFVTRPKGRECPTGGSI